MSDDVCACGHDETDHGTVIVGCIHCGNCDRYIRRSTYVSERRSVAASQTECDLAEVLHAHDSVTWADALDLSASLLSGPLAPLLAKLRAVEELADDLDREGVAHLFHGPHNWNEHITARIRSILAES